MKRRLFNMTALVSLSAAVAIAALWLRSYWWEDHWFSPASSRFNFHLGSWAGGLSVATGVATGDGFDVTENHGFVWKIRTVEGPRLWSTLWRFYAARGELWEIPASAPVGHRYDLMFPHWAPLLASLLLPACWLWRRVRAPQPSACPACGYDLRGSEGVTCPECGAERHARPGVGGVTNR